MFPQRPCIPCWGDAWDWTFRAIEVPEHAFAILYDGTRHADVETTTSSGFDPARDVTSQEQFYAKTGFQYIPDSNRDQRQRLANRASWPSSTTTMASA